jgi:hypothetical protein
VAGATFLSGVDDGVDEMSFAIAIAFLIHQGKTNLPQKISVDEYC